MRTQLTKIAIAASFGLALILSCSSGSDDSGVSESPLGYDSISSGANKSSSSASIVASSCDGLSFKTVVVGTQTWMAENLNCNVSGSLCYNNQESNCDKYGRLYDWATAMALPSSCNTSSCALQIDWNHRGICPTGWHIPTNEDLDKLMRYVGTSNGLYDGSTASKYLKTASGWNSNGNGEDKYSFAALPGGYGNSSGYFAHVGDYGYWWSASEDDALSAYNRYMGYNNEDTYWGSSGKGFLFSIRCLQNSSSSSYPSSSSSYRPSSSSSYPSSSSSYRPSSSSSYSSSSSVGTSGGICTSYYNAYISCLQSSGNTSSCSSYATAYSNCYSNCSTAYSSCINACSSCASSCLNSYYACIGQQ